MPRNFDAFPFPGPAELRGRARTNRCREEAAVAELFRPHQFVAWNGNCTRRCGKNQVRKKNGHCTTFGPTIVGNKNPWIRHVKKVAAQYKGQGLSAAEIAKIAKPTYKPPVRAIRVVN